MKCSYHSAYQAAVPSGFPKSKQAFLKERLLAEGILAGEDILEPEPISLEAALLVHTSEYLDKLQAGRFSAAEQRRLGLSWSEALWRRSRLASGGTLLAARHALGEGLAGNLAGGGHHAFPDHGEGFCILNDVAIAVCKLRAEGRLARAMIIDLDVHQGNGTAAIFDAVPEVFTFSVHGERNYPSAKMRSTLDLALRDGAGDAEYLDTLEQHLPAALDRADAEIAFYLAGVDVVQGDRFGRLALTEDGLLRRERLVVGAVRNRRLPLIIVLAGGYAATPTRTAELHAHAFREAAAYERRERSAREAPAREAVQTDPKVTPPPSAL
jgi:acetoin utilization deacetylase AcuC-like enzyme